MLVPIISCVLSFELLGISSTALDPAMFYFRLITLVLVELVLIGLGVWYFARKSHVPFRYSLFLIGPCSVLDTWLVHGCNIADVWSDVACGSSRCSSASVRPGVRFWCTS